MVEYSLDSLERRCYRPRFRFDFPWGPIGFFAQVEYLSRMNGRLQGAIDFWVNAGLQRRLPGDLAVELRLNHFCRHESLRDIPYVWNLNELLARVILERGRLSLALGAGPFVGGSEGYRWLASASGEWRSFLLPELTLEAELKLVDQGRLYHEAGFSLALSPAVDLFFRNARSYELRNSSYLGLRFHSHPHDDSPLDAMKVLVGAMPFHERFKLEAEGDFRLEFFRNESRRLLAAIKFETPILNGDGFFAQFWPGRMIYEIGLDYEQRLKPELYAAWIARYSLDMPVDEDLPFAASLLSGLALRNQPDFDVMEKNVRWEVAAGYDFKRGLELGGKLGLGIWSGAGVKIASELKGRADGGRLRLDFRLLAACSPGVELRPYVGWKKDVGIDPEQETPGKLLFGLGFFKKF